jgi:AraC-like DNA-binding protein
MVQPITQTCLERIYIPYLHCVDDGKKSKIGHQLVTWHWRRRLNFLAGWRNIYIMTIHIDNLPELTPAQYGYVVDRKRPVLSLLFQETGPHRTTAHRHPRAQIVFPIEGSYWVLTDQGNWLVLPNQAVWIPPEVNHEIMSHNSVKSLLLFVDGAYVDTLPQQCVTVNVSPLLRELIKKAVANGNNFELNGPEARLVSVMLDELNSMTPAPFYLPLSTNRILSRTMTYLIENPGDRRGLEVLAKDVGASPRTLSRLFSRETGMTYSQWRLRLRLMEAVERLGQGQTIAQVTFDLGYSSDSTFIDVFRRSLGITPGQYVNQVTDRDGMVKHP